MIGVTVTLLVLVDYALVCNGSQHSQQQRVLLLRVARASVSKLGEPRSESLAVSAITFNASSGGSLLVGHASGEVALWEFRRSGWEAAKARCAFLGTAP